MRARGASAAASHPRLAVHRWRLTHGLCVWPGPSHTTAQAPWARRLNPVLTQETRTKVHGRCSLASVPLSGPRPQPPMEQEEECLVFERKLST